MRLGVGALGVVDVVRGDERQVELARELDEDAVEHRLLGQTVVLELDVETPRLEDVAQRREHLAPARLALLEHGLRRRARPCSRSSRRGPWRVAARSSRAIAVAPARASGGGATCPRDTSQTRFLYPSSARGEHRQVVRRARLARTLRARSRGWPGPWPPSRPCRSVIAPNMLPWSVTATARIPAAATRLTRSLTFTAPSSSEYCEWTWR